MARRKSFGEQLRKERQKQRLTAEKVAKASGISRSFMTLIENNKRLPSRKKIPKIAATLKIKTGTVLNWYLEDMSRKIHNDLKNI